MAIKIKKVPANRAERGFGQKTKRARQFDYKVVEELAKQGMSDCKIAIRLGCDPSTVQNHKDKDPEFRAAIERGRARGEEILSDRLFSAATNPNHRSQVDALKFILARRHGWAETVVNQHEGTGPGAAPIVVQFGKDDEAL